jgi:hypothetical protein
MYPIDDAIVMGGRLILSDLLFSDGQRVRIVVTEADAVQRQTT